MDELQAALSEAARAIAGADRLLIGAGAGMGVDSGLPDFRGNQGFWNAYPALRQQGVGFAEMANPRWFRHDVGQAWGFYGHRLNLYRRTEPHAGFAELLRWGERLPGGLFVYTSNVDGQFQKAGFPGQRIVECHGSIHHLQCSAPCGEEVWPADGEAIDVDEANCRAAGNLPMCPKCAAPARPNILMFSDYQWIDRRTEEQLARFKAWLRDAPPGGIVKIELGAGTAVPSVRMTMDRVPGALVRVNPREPDGPGGTISIPSGALGAITRIGELLAPG
ncbi:MAG: Sir2 family NAD-dependent protein deacetylase [Planctomycetota bacterium]